MALVQLTPVTPDPRCPQPQPKHLELPHIGQDKPLEPVLTGGRNAIPEDRVT